MAIRRLGVVRLIGEQLARTNAKRIGQFFDRLDGWGSLAALDPAQIDAMQVRSMGKGILR